MNKQQITEEQVDAAEKALKRKHGNKLPFLFIVFFAAICGGLETILPAQTYGAHFVRLAFFGWFIWTICRMLEKAAARWKRETVDNTEKGHKII